MHHVLFLLQDIRKLETGRALNLRKACTIKAWAWWLHANEVSGRTFYLTFYSRRIYIISIQRSLVTYASLISNRILLKYNTRELLNNKGKEILPLY
jgi:hypothetical protein